METFVKIIFIIIGLGIGLSTTLFIFKGGGFNFEKRKRAADEKIAESQSRADHILKEAKEKVQRAKEYLQQEIQRRTERIEKLKQSLTQKEASTEKRQEKLNEIKLKLASEKEGLQTVEESIKRLDREYMSQLASKTGQKVESIKENILKEYQQNLEQDNIEKLATIEENLKENALKMAKKIVINVMQRLCTETSVETRAVNVKVPKDHIKGKIVGKDAQNVKVLEDELDVDIVFNDLPHTITVSAFNLVNRRIAQRTLEILVKLRGEINKAVILKTIKQAEKEVEKELYKLGKSAVDHLGFKNFDEEFIKIIGRLKYRTSYGQNIMKHSKEVAWVSAMLGAELGLDEHVCRVAGFLHDVGKAIDQDPNITDPHDLLSKKLMEKYGFSWEEVHAAWTHHDAEPQETPEALIVKAADAVSAGRPGARQESIEKYIERLQAIERTVRSFDGIKNTYAISAGREVRIFVDPQAHNDTGIGNLAENVARKIENDLKYPGKIKVNVIRRTKSTEIAK